MSLSGNDTYIAATLSKLTSIKEPIVLRSLLAMLQKMHQVSERPAAFVRKYKLFDVVLAFEKDAAQVLVARTANKLRFEFEESLQVERLENVLGAEEGHALTNSSSSSSANTT